MSPASANGTAASDARSWLASAPRARAARKRSRTKRQGQICVTIAGMSNLAIVVITVKVGRPAVGEDSGGSA